LNESVEADDAWSRFLSQNVRNVPPPGNDVIYVADFAQ